MSGLLDDSLVSIPGRAAATRLKNKTDCWIGPIKKGGLWAVVVAQSLPLKKDPGSNPVISNFY